jgi:hypothetical protein
LPSFKAAGRDADHSLPSSTEVKNAWSYTSTPPYVTPLVLRKGEGRVAFIRTAVKDNFEGQRK